MAIWADSFSKFIKLDKNHLLFLEIPATLRLVAAYVALPRIGRDYAHPRHKDPV